MHSISAFVILVIGLAFLFDFINGFHDAGNSIATLVTTRVMTPRQAVIWAAFFNFIAFMVFKLSVAQTIGHGLIDMRVVSVELIFSALVAAVSWNIATWYLGLPSSASHALIGGLAGAAILKGGWAVLIPSGFTKVFIGIIVAPIMGILMGWVVMHYFKWHFDTQSEKKFKKTFKRLQLLSSACLSLTHGGNDAQKTMGIIALLLFTTSTTSEPFSIPLWVVIACHAVISLGTLFGGWRVVKTMGERITQLNPMRGCAAETGSAVLLFIATEAGVPMSTTQTVTGAIAGVGLGKGWDEVNWGVLSRIFLSWVLTIPATGLFAAAIMWVFA
ncbi:MAG: inorganic phosphate transporter [Gammaproteobacteria bacterium]|nr:inorganic phosphate transporter [Gammaproteobacteria bacterium]